MSEVSFEENLDPKRKPSITEMSNDYDGESDSSEETINFGNNKADEKAHTSHINEQGNNPINTKQLLLIY